VSATTAADGSEGVLVQSHRQERPELAAALLAAAAECGVIFLPAKTIALEGVAPSGGPLVGFPWFAGLFLAAVAASFWFRRSHRLPWTMAAGAAAVGLAQGAVFGARTVLGTALAIALCLAVALRALTLGLRDWRNPIDRSFGWGAAAVLVEILLAESVRGDWPGLLPFVVPAFFLGSLASRTESVRLSAGAGLPLAGRARIAGAAVGGLAALLALAVPLGGRGGAFQALGRLLEPAFRLVVTVLAFVLGQAIRPFAFIAEHLHVDPDAIRRLFDRLRAGRPRGGTVRVPQAGTAQRIVGLVVLVLAVALLAWAIQRYRKRLRRTVAGMEEPPPPRVTPLPAPRARLREAVRMRRELPDDTVRRWYAEALVLLEEKGLTKAPNVTPGEHLLDVGRAFPECGPGFVVLTRAYEDVRYGNRRFDRRVLGRIEPHRNLVMDSLRRARRIDDQGEA
jgi:uncharacterized protein DUF4129